jgi:hypothetical protein
MKLFLAYYGVKGSKKLRTNNNSKFFFPISFICSTVRRQKLFKIQQAHRIDEWMVNKVGNESKVYPSK